MVPQREAEKRGNPHTCELEELVKISPPIRNASKLCTIPKMAEEICNPLAPSFVQFWFPPRVLLSITAVLCCIWTCRNQDLCRVRPAYRPPPTTKCRNSSWGLNKPGTT